MTEEDRHDCEGVERGGHEYVELKVDYLLNRCWGGGGGGERGEGGRTCL